MSQRKCRNVLKKSKKVGARGIHPDCRRRKYEIWRARTNTWNMWDGFINIWRKTVGTTTQRGGPVVSKPSKWAVGYFDMCSEMQQTGWNSLVRLLVFFMLQSQYLDPLLELTLSFQSFHFPQTGLGVIILSLMLSMKVSDATIAPVFPKALRCFNEILFPFHTFANLLMWSLVVSCPWNCSTFNQWNGSLIVIGCVGSVF